MNVKDVRLLCESIHHRAILIATVCCLTEGWAKKHDDNMVEIAREIYELIKARGKEELSSHSQNPHEEVDYRRYI